MTENPSYSQVIYSFNANDKFDFGMIKALKAICPAGPVVDFGAGFGRTIGACEGKHYLVENDIDMLEILSTKVLNPNIHDVEILHESAHLTSLPEKTASICTFCWGALAEMRPITFALFEASRVLVDGGGIYCYMLNPEAPKIGDVGLSFSTLKEFPCSANILTYPYRDMGKYEYLTQFEARGRGWHRLFTFRQIFPPVEILMSFMEKIGFSEFEFTGSRSDTPFSTSESRLYHMTARKKSKQQTCFQPELHDLYEQASSTYDDIVEKTKYTVFDWMKRKISKYENAFPKILDLGCGNGIAADKIKEVGCQPVMYGVDFSEKMIQEAKEKKYYSGLMVYDLAKNFPILEELEFNIIIGMGITEFIPDITSFLDSVKRSLVLGGEALITFELTMSDSHQSGQRISGCQFIKYHYSVEKVVALLQQAGLTINSIEKNFAYHSPLLKKDIKYLFVHATRKSL